MSINLQIDVDDQATPVLAGLLDDLTDPTQFHRVLALDLAEYTRRHIRMAATSRHRTAARLGSNPTGYLSRAAETVEATGDAGGVTLRVAGAIFRRVNGPVTVRPREKKYLTIPLIAEAAGRKAQEFSWPAINKTGRSNRKGKRPRLLQGLFVITSKQGNKLLVRRNDDGTITPYYSLRTSVTLPQDTGLLPDAQQLGQVAEKAAGWYLQRRMRQAGVSNA